MIARRSMPRCGPGGGRRLGLRHRPRAADRPGGPRVGLRAGIGCDRRGPPVAGPRRAEALTAKGQRYYDWARIRLAGESGQHWLLVRRHPPTAADSPSTVVTPGPRSPAGRAGPGRRTTAGPSRKASGRQGPGSTRTSSAAGWLGGAGPDRWQRGKHRGVDVGSASLVTPSRRQSMFWLVGDLLAGRGPGAVVCESHAGVLLRELLSILTCRPKPPLVVWFN